MADPHSPRPVGVVIATWLAMVGCSFSALAAVLGLVALLLLREGVADLPLLDDVAAQFQAYVLAALAWSLVGLHVSTLVWRRNQVARWLLLASCGAVLLAWPWQGRTGAFWGVPAAVTGLLLLLPSTTAWLRGTVRTTTPRPTPVSRPWSVWGGAVTALVGHLLAVVPLLVVLTTLATSDIAEADPELAELVDPVNLETWGLALSVLAIGGFLGLALAAFVALGRSGAARLVVVVAAGVLLVLDGQALRQAGAEPGVALWAGVGVVLALVPLVLLTLPQSNAWYRDAAPVEPEAPAEWPAYAPLHRG